MATSTRRCTVHLLQDVEASHAGMRRGLDLRYQHDHNFGLHEVTVADAPALLYVGVIVRGQPPDWVAAVDRLTGLSPMVQSQTAAAALLVAVGGQVFALTYGLGHLLLAHGRDTPGFGFGYALRTLQPDAVKEVTHRAMDARGRTDRVSVGHGQSIRGFGIEEYGAVVSRLVGKLAATGLTVSGGRAVQISGTDALKIPLGMRPSDLIADLTEVGRVLAEVPPAPEFDLIDRVRPLTRSDERWPELDRLLAQLVADPSRGSLALTAPTSLLDAVDEAGSYRVKIGRGRHEEFDQLDLDDVVRQASVVPEESRVAALRQGYIQMRVDGEAHGRRAPAMQWLVAEVPLRGSRFLLHEGRWFEVGDQHVEAIRQQVHELLSAPPDIELIDWTPDLADEKAYNAAAGPHGFVNLDRSMVPCDLHPRGFEACDLLGPEGELIHVKRADSTAPLNHLFAQGILSAHTLRFDATARRRLGQIVGERASGRDFSVDFQPRKVVYAISLRSGKPLLVENLFTFAQVTLLHAVTALRNVGIEVAVVGIRTVGEPSDVAA